LIEEHRVIKSMLQCLNKIVEEASKSGKLNLEAAKTAIDFFRNFADRCHHSKEEDRLFPVMEESGVPRDGGPLGVMLMEHDSGRSFIQGMLDSMEKAAEGETDALNAFVENAGHYQDLLAEHIHKEDHCLFPMADHALNEASQETLLENFRKVEKEEGKRHETYLRMARDLCGQYGVTFLSEDQLKVITSEFLK